MNSKLNIIFPGIEHIFMPVIHMDEKAIAFMNAKIAFDCGADAVWLIGHELPPEEFMKNALEIKRLMPDKWIGVNILKAKNAETIQLFDNRMDGLWKDFGGIREEDDGTINVTDAGTIDFYIGEMNTFNLQTLYFGGVAFKYIKDVKTNFKEAAKRAVDFMDVITTTGEETGKPPSIEKIKAMKEGAGDHPLAIASGMTAENVKEFMPHVRCFLVATGISKDFYNLDPSETRAFARAIGK
ncbi:MAG: hypothetical protein KBF62_02875 [Candidatus Pacebacteria bacterium]|nr:hypothetical protein [Candidatus Paceibacterota bacterium]MBP9058557.1 hypothetical protein [Candidatus Paceibacterota bacterium]MBP9769870.1 hypothetical protein [Candidatus Paceibacterota bacterium]